jgi:hypothetical protein
MLLELHGWDIHTKRPGAGGAGVTEVRCHAHATPTATASKAAWGPYYVGSHRPGCASPLAITLVSFITQMAPGHYSPAPARAGHRITMPGTAEVTW